MKRCPTCKTEKMLEDFAVATHRKDGRQSECKVCKRLRDAASYRRDPAAYKARTQRQYNQNKLWLCDYLSHHPCVDCGESDIVVLEFDHIEEKANNVTALLTCSIRKLKEEISKCEVRCANCHARITYMRRNSHIGV